jgi:putative phosphoribosyl transferase
MASDAGMPPRYRDRADAGRELAAELVAYAGRPDVLVLGLPRGGVPVAFEVAVALNVPLDVFVVRKLGVPGHEELAMGAIASGGVRVLNEGVIGALHVSDADIEHVTQQELQELHRRELRYRGNRPFPSVAGRTVILVDDGLATGSTMRAAVHALRLEDPAAVVVAVPIAAAETCDEFRPEVEEIVCAVTPEPFYAVGLWYADFSQTTDEEVHELLDEAGRRFQAAHSGRRDGNDGASARREEERTVLVTAGSATLEGSLGVPASARGVVLFAHGSGSSRHSARNRYVADVLRRAGLATLLIDLLTPEEEAVDLRTRELRFDIELLAERLVAAMDWMAGQPTTHALPVGLFGASTGGGAALVAAARRPDRVAAVVSRGGRPDLARDALAYVRAPTLLVVGGRDESVVELNQAAMRRLLAAPTPPHVRLEIVPGATHLFEEPGALERVATLARDWFVRNLPAPASAAR